MHCFLSDTMEPRHAFLLLSLAFRANYFAYCHEMRDLAVSQIKFLTNFKQGNRGHDTSPRFRHLANSTIL